MEEPKNKYIGTKVEVLDKGHATLVDYMGNDYAITQAARVSYGKGTKQVSKEEALIRYMLNHGHSSVFEQCVVKLHVKAPLFVLAQWLRHRTLSANQLSARYSEMEDSFYLPSEDRIQKQSLENRQGSGECLNTTEALRIIEELKDEQEVSYSIYQKRLKEDEVSRELARINLPQSLYSELYITQNLHNLLHFLRLRMDSHAQYEIRMYANAVYELIQPLFPITCEAFEDYVISAKRLSRHELSLLKDVLSSLANEEELSKKIKAQLTLGKDKYKLSKREIREFKGKLGLK